MGAIGNKPKKFRSKESFDEPEMLVDLNSIQNKAIEEGYVIEHKFDIERFINNKYPNIKIKHEDLSPDISGKLEMKDDMWVMTVNSKHPSVRQRFTLGHELGHYLNHRKSVKSFCDTVFFRSNQKSSMEYMADQFAARLLMPESDIESLFKSGVNTVKEMASNFDVSLEAMKYRLEQLGYGIKKNN
nr:MAG TPA: IrrE protein [Caudoviricetes sp.]